MEPLATSSRSAFERLRCCDRRTCPRGPVAGDGQVEGSVVLNDQSVMVRAVSQLGSSPDTPRRAGNGLMGRAKGEQQQVVTGQWGPKLGFEVVADLPIEGARCLLAH